jgi:murein DD-endopeptidase MepM/ murein hydrolase activator NlpD
MLAIAKKPRGATATRREDRRPPGLRLPGDKAMAGLALLACVATALVLQFTDNNATISQPAVNPETALNDTFPNSDLWLITAPTESGTTPAETNPGQQAAGPAEQPWVEQVVKSGDNLSRIFQRAGFNKGDVHQVVSESEHGKSLARIYPGQVVAFQSDDGGKLAAVRIVKSPLETIIYSNSDTGFSSEIATRTPQVRESWATAEITSSLFLAGKQAGLSYATIMELAAIYGGVIDFVLDPRQGDTIHLVYEELYLDNKKYSDGTIVAASFTNQGKTYNAFRYVDASGDPNYYNEDGVSMRKAFLLAPVDFTRISSNFNMRRLHPIYKTTRPHRGTDYAAPTGTPVYAAGDGRVLKAGYSRANGNYVFIRHGDQFVTHYLHLHKRKVKAGQRVTQSQVIGTVGSTGAATGPHLHYEFLVNGAHRDPRKIHKSLPKAKTLPKTEMPGFHRAINNSSLQLASLRSDNQLAMNNSASLDSAAN